MGVIPDLSKSNLLQKARFTVARRIFPVRKTQVFFLDKLEIGLTGPNVSQIDIPSVTLPNVTSDLCPRPSETYPIIVPNIPTPAITTQLAWVAVDFIEVALHAILKPEITSEICLVEPEVLQLRVFPPYVQLITCSNSHCLKTLRLQIDLPSMGKDLEAICPSCHQKLLHRTTIEEAIVDLTTWLKEQLICPGIESLPLLLDPPRRAGKSYTKDGQEDKQPELLPAEDENCIHGIKKSWCSTCIQKEKRESEKTTSIVDLFDLVFPILLPPLGDNFDSPVAFPPGMELYPFQREGVRFLAEHERALLGDEMGLGKSIQAIVALRFLFRLSKITNGLILCPKSVLTDWEKKLWDWAPELRVIKVRGLREQREILWNTPGHIYLTTYETVRQDLPDSLGDNTGLGDTAKKEFDFIILDETQKIKSPSANVSKAMRFIKGRFCWGLSGTPLENRLEDLISIFAYIKPGLLGPNDLRYANAAGPWKIKEAIKPYVLRRRKADVLPDLPEKLYEEAWLELTPAQKETYERAEKEGIVTLNEQGDAVTVQHVLALITKLKQICNLDVKSKESCKLEYLSEKLEDTSEQGDKALVFSQYPDKTLAHLEPQLKKFKPLIYSGSLSESQRDTIVKSFQEQEDNKVLLMSVKAGGLGLTLTRANYVYHYDLWWNPAVAAQAEDRTHRIGQKKTVFVTYLLTVNTIEERIQNLLKKKRQLFKEVIDDLSDENLSNLTEEDLFGLFNIQKRKREPIQDKVTRETLVRISPQEFEALIANLYERMGYHVILTPQTRDKGVDVHAKRISDAGTENLAIQCKHYPNGSVGVEHARSLYGVIQDQPSITKGILVTSGTFSSECRQFSSGKRMELVEGSHLLGLLEKYSVPLVRS